MTGKNSKIALGKGIAKVGSVLMEALISYTLFQPGAETQGAARDIDHAGRSERDFSRAFQDRGRRA
jgi:hypothetical protein